VPKSPRIDLPVSVKMGSCVTMNRGHSMEPLIIILVPGVLGGIAMALLIAQLRVRSRSATDGHRLAPPSPGLINIAHIRPEGLGGLGMVAMAIVVAIFVPRIRLSMTIALLLGGALAAFLVARRRTTGPLSSGTDHPGAHSILGIVGPLQTGRQASMPRSAANDEPRQHRMWLPPQPGHSSLSR
jgi:hypothetical protein